MIYCCFNKLELTQCYPSNNVPLTHLHSDMFPGKRVSHLTRNAWGGQWSEAHRLLITGREAAGVCVCVKN